MKLPWVKLRQWAAVNAKRTRREWKLKLALTRLSGMGAVGGLFGGGLASADPAEISDSDRVTALSSMGFDVVKVKRE